MCLHSLWEKLLRTILSTYKMHNCILSSKSKPYFLTILEFPYLRLIFVYKWLDQSIIIYFPNHIIKINISPIPFFIYFYETFLSWNWVHTNTDFYMPIILFKNYLLFRKGSNSKNMLSLTLIAYIPHPTSSPCNTTNNFSYIN